MIVLAGALLGAVVGATTARVRGGNGLDMAQYAVGYAIAFAILNLFLTLVIGRLG